MILEEEPSLKMANCLHSRIHKPDGLLSQGENFSEIPSGWAIGHTSKEFQVSAPANNRADCLTGRGYLKSTYRCFLTMNFTNFNYACVY